MEQQEDKKKTRKRLLSVQHWCLGVHQVATPHSTVGAMKN
jgi:hypothetical protein